MTPKRAAAAMTLAGFVVFLWGVASIYAPAALILGGGGVAAYGLFGVGVDGPKGGGS